MVKAVTLRERVQIVSLHKQGKSFREIASALQLSCSAVRRWVKNWEEGGDMEEKPKSGRPRVLSSRAKFTARKLLKQPGFGGLARAARALRDKGLTPTVVHKSTLSRMLKESEMKTPTQLVADSSKPTRALSDVDKERRVQFAKVNISRNWDAVMFTDRSRFYFKYPGCKVPRVQWHERGENRQAPKPNNPKCVNVYMGITKYGATAPVIVTGTSKHQTTFITRAGKLAKNITSAEYEVVLTDHLLPGGAELMLEHGQREWVFQQDNDPAHNCAATVIAKYNRQHATSIKLLPNWPPHSPDLNLIENWWAEVNQKMDAFGCKTFTEFKNKLCSTLADVPAQWLHNAYAGMAQRLKDTIVLKGGKTKH